MEEETAGLCLDAPNDWLEHVHLLPDRPKSVVEDRCKQLFAVDVRGRKGHDMYVNILPNGVCIVGLAPSHHLIRQHRQQGEAAAAAMQVDPTGGSTSLGAADTDAAARQEEAAASEPAEAAGASGAAEVLLTADITGPPAEAAGTSGAAEVLPTANITGVAPVDQEKQQAGTTGGKPPIVGSKRSRQGGGARAKEGGLTEVNSFPLAELSKVNFDVGHRSLGDVRDSGKKKANPGMVMRPSSGLCQVESTAGQYVFVSATIPGKLLEVNTRLVADGSLLFKRPCREGYLAILFPCFPVNTCCQSCLE